MNHCKQILYRYNGDADSDEIILDPSGNHPVPSKDEIIDRNESRWKVVSVTTEVETEPLMFPIVRVFLISHPRAE